MAYRGDRSADAARQGALRALCLLLGMTLAAAVVFVTGPGPLRFAASLGIVLGPGLALTPLLNVGDRAVGLVLVMLISAACLVCAAQAVTYLASFSWRPCVIMLLAVTAVGAAAQIATAKPMRGR